VADIIRRVVSLACALLTGVALLVVLARGAGPVPALGAALTPGRGVWPAADGVAVRSQQLRLSGLRHPVTVSFTSAGLASVSATTDYDVFLAQGYLTADLRLTQMDLDRRLGEGRLAAIEGSAALGSDQFELRLGLLRTAEAEWAATPPGSAAGQALIAYSRGVNDRLAQLQASHQWPALYPLTGTRPAPWTPVDSLVIQEVLTQQLDFSTTPLDYALLSRSLGASRTMKWFPVQPTNPQQPYDAGPYSYRKPVPMDLPDANAATVTAGTTAAAPRDQAQPAQEAAAESARASQSILSDLRSLPAGAQQVYLDSNSWAVNGPKLAGAQSLLAGDPHLQLTLPSVWFEVALHSPSYDVTGASLPGLPAVVIGRNAHIAWSITDAENQSAFFYTEQTSGSHPGSYYWRGAWRPFRQVRYSIPVHGSAPTRLTVDLTAQGPVMTTTGQTTAVYWAGDVPSADLTAILGVDRAASFGGFRQALRQWGAPALNFTYADDQGNIGVLGAGYYPQVPPHSAPWLPMSGTGDNDVIGTIPFAEVPQVYDPPGHVVVTANQPPVSAKYPYYIGTSSYFDPGYRTSEITDFLETHRQLTTAAMTQLQHNVTDQLAVALVPPLLRALAAGPLTSQERAARDLLASWNDDMSVGSAAASVWWTFFTTYLSDVFQPWWTAQRVPTHLDPGALDLSTVPTSLQEDLQQWTLRDPSNPAFTPPGGPTRDAATVMRLAFAQTVSKLSKKLGPDPRSWSWGRLHRREIPSLLGAAALGEAPYPAGGTGWTVDAADGGLTSSFGPSWRMITSWTAPGTAVTQLAYPGGQSEDPGSPWYENLLASWNDGRYLSPPGGQSPGGGLTWDLRPGA
jgi:penicillin amidase